MLADHLLLAILSGQGAPVRGRDARIAEGVLRVLLAEGAVEQVGAFLSPQPGAPATYEVSVTPEDRPEERIEFEADVDAAVRDAVRRATDVDTTVEVLASRGGIRRVVLRSSPSRAGRLEFVPPGPDTMMGDEEAVRAAMAEWAALEPAPVVAAPVVAAPVAAAPEPQPAAVEAADIVDAVRSAMSDLVVDMDPDTVRAAVQGALAESAIEIDLTPVEAAVKAALADATMTLDASSVEAALHRALSRLPTRTDIETMASRLGAQSGATAAEALTRLDLARRADLQGLESRLRNAIVATEAPPAGTGVPAVQPMPSDELLEAVARAVAEQLGPLMPERSERDAGGAWIAQATLMSAADQLHLQLQSFDDRIRAGSRSIEALADELASRERTAARLTEQMSRRVEAALERLAVRLEGRVPPGWEGDAPAGD